MGKQTFEKECVKSKACSGFSFPHGKTTASFGCLKKCFPKEFGGYGKDTYDYWALKCYTKTTKKPKKTTPKKTTKKPKKTTPKGGKCAKLGFKYCAKASCSWDGGECKEKGGKTTKKPKKTTPKKKTTKKKTTPKKTTPKKPKKTTPKKTTKKPQKDHPE